MISTRFPSDSVFNHQASALPLHAMSAQWVARFFPPDRGFDVWTGGTYGLKVEDASMAPGRAMTFDWPQTSDQVLYPLRDNHAFDIGNPDSHWCGVSGSMLYEVYSVHAGQNDHAACGAHWNLASNDLRPDGLTSAIESGLPWSTGAIRYDEMHAQDIRHALLFSLSWPAVANTWVWPARNVSVRPGVVSDAIPMGTRMRLRGDYQVPPGMTLEAARILAALRDYGALLSDRNGSLANPALTGLFSLEAEPDSRTVGILNEVRSRTLGIAQFVEFVDESAFQYAPDSGRWKR